MKGYFDLENNEIDTMEEYHSGFLNNDEDERTKYFKKEFNAYPNYPKNNGCGFKYKKLYRYQFDELREKYDFENIAGDKSDFEKSVNIMSWMGEHSFYYGDSRLNSRNSIEMINKYFDKGFQGAINCFQKSIVMSDILCSLGIYATPATITVNVFDKTNKNFCGHGRVHVVVHAYMTDLNKWVMFDPSYNAYVIDKHNNAMNLIEIREAYNNSDEIILAQYNLNGTNAGREDYIYDSLTIYNFRIQLKQDNKFYHLIPEGLDFKGYIMHIQRNKSEEEKTNIEKEVDEYKYLDSFEFLSIPEPIQ